MQKKNIKNKESDSPKEVLSDLLRLKHRAENLRMYILACQIDAVIVSLEQEGFHEKLKAKLEKIATGHTGLDRETIK